MTEPARPADAAGDTAVIELDRLTRRYGARRGVDELTFDVVGGEVFGFLGPNGAGKTTLIRMLMGFIGPTSGRARIFGRDVWRESHLVRRSVAYLSGDPAYLGELTAAQTLDFLGRSRGLRAGCWNALASRLDLDARVPIRKLSRGNRQKVGLIQVFMGDEPLLVMDEPTTGLDPLMQREFLRLVQEARAGGRTVFLSSHNLPEVERACDRIGIIRSGVMVEIRSVRELLAAHLRTVVVLFGDPPPPGALELPGVTVVAQAGAEWQLAARGDIRPLLGRLADLSVRDVAIRTPEVEEVFMAYYDEAGSPGGDRPSDVPPAGARA
jgi:ABC-2 type transport system ATP-binding protein